MKSFGNGLAMLKSYLVFTHLECINARFVEVLFDGSFGVLEGFLDGGDLGFSVLVDVLVFLHFLEVIPDARLGLLGRLDESIVFGRYVLGPSHPRYTHVVPGLGGEKKISR